MHEALRSGEDVIAALYVETGGCYFGLADVEPWDKARDARLYVGPHPVVAHPPCERWGRYWHGGPSAKVRRQKGDDAGCFAAALGSVRQWGGVLEHPEASSAWAAFGLITPPHSGGWVVADDRGGWTCRIDQAHFGHRARKATWLYTVGCGLPSLPWGRAKGIARLDAGFHSSGERARFRSGLRQDIGVSAAERIRSRDLWESISGMKHFARLGARERAATPAAFRDLLLSMARSVYRGSEYRRAGGAK